MARQPQEKIIPLPGAYQGGGKDGERVIAIPAGALTEQGMLVGDGQGHYGLRVEAEVSSKSHWLRHGMIGAAIGGLVTAVFTTGIAQPLIESGKNFLGLNPTIPGRSASPVAGAGQETPTPKPTLTHSPSQAPSPTPTATATKTTKTKKSPAECVTQNLTPEQQIGQLLILGVYSTKKDANNMPTVAETFNSFAVGGVVIMNQPTDIYDSNATINSFKKSQDITPSFYVDQEGGTVQRIGYPKNGKRILSQEAVGKLSEKDRTKYIEQVILPMYQFLKDKGFDGTLGPVVDLGVKKNSPLPERTFSTDPKVVAEIAVLYAKAAEDAGLYPFAKHAPGLGEASGNTDHTSAITPPWKTIKERSLAPYKAIADENIKAGAMMGSQKVDGLTTGPAALSPEAVKVLRDILGDDAVILTDDLNTPAIKAYEQSKGVKGDFVTTATLQALQAGVDQVIIVKPATKTWKQQLEGITTKVTETMDSNDAFATSVANSVAKVLKLKGLDPCKMGK